jgi:hypothetical protein
LLAEAPVRPVPATIILRSKTGFGVPVQQWLSELGKGAEGDGMSRGWARELVTMGFTHPIDKGVDENYFSDAIRVSPL